MKFLLINQTFYPDNVATAQHLADLALALAQEHEVTVLTGQRSYSDPATVFPEREIWNRIRIRRVRTSGLGKSKKIFRIADFASFWMSACRIALTTDADCVIALTTPPLIALLAALHKIVRRSRFVYWVMDMNPDEALAAGWLKPGIIARLLESISRWTFRRADLVIALDRYMQERIERKGVPPERIIVVPPWSHDEHVHFDAEGRAAFRRRLGIDDKFVVMYSGNHSPCHPIQPLLDAALALREHTDIAFAFVGGGSEFAKIAPFREQHSLENILALPYQPLSELSASLSAADLHVVIMGAPFVGIVHPCKLYNIVQVGCPFLYLGPAQSHITDLIAANQRANDEAMGAYVCGPAQPARIAEQILKAKSQRLGRVHHIDTFAFSSRALIARLIDAVCSRTSASTASAV